LDWETVEDLLQESFKEYHYNGSGGNEFYNFDIIHMIEDRLIELGFDYKEVDIADINKECRKLELQKRFIKNLKKNTRVKKYYRKLDELKKRCPIEQIENTIKQIEMRDYQTDEKIMNWFDEYDKGILNWICGLGKTITSLNISKKYVKDYLLIGLNNLGLFGQWIDSIVKFYDLPILCICSSNIDGHTTTTNINVIKGWLNKNPKGIVITSYRSAYKLKDLDISFDFEILDECHHLCSVKNYDKDGEEIEEDSNKKTYGKNTDILSLNVKKRLGLTATMKEIDDDNNGNKIDNMNVSKFGDIIDNKSLLWGIENGHVCDYRLSVPRITYQELEDIIGHHLNKDSCYLYLSAYIALMTLTDETCNKLLIFVNKIRDMEELYKIIMIMLRTSIDFSHIDYQNIFKANNDDIKTFEIVRKFNEIDKGILINCYKIGEGVDIPSLDGVLFADNMESTIRITQGALRACRKDPNNKEKKATIIVPTIYEKEEDKSYDENDNIKGFGTILNIIKELSISDVNVIQKIKTPVFSSSNSSRRPSRSFYQEIDEEYKFKMRIITRGELGKKTFPSCKRIIQKMGGRKEDNITFYTDYEKNKQGVNGLPDINWMKKYLDQNDKSWIELYSFDIRGFPSWSEFEKKYKKKLTYEEYEEKVNYNMRLPKAHDLEDIYGNSNYNRGFWDDSCYDDEY